MGSTKQYWFDVQEQIMHDWVQDYLGVPDADEDTEGWDEAINLYSEMQEYKENQAELEAEYLVLKQTSYLEYFEIFQSQMDNIKQLLNTPSSSNSTMIKMICSHSVTILESYLSDYIKHLIINNPKFLDNFIKNDDMGKIKYSLKDYHNEELGVIGVVLKNFNKNSFHNIKQTINILSAMLNCKLDIDISDISKVIERRHDLVHRNGRTIEGGIPVLDLEMATDFVRIVENFGTELQKKITAEINA